MKGNKNATIKQVIYFFISLFIVYHIIAMVGYVNGAPFFYDKALFLLVFSIHIMYFLIYGITLWLSHFIKKRAYWIFIHYILLLSLQVFLFIFAKLKITNIWDRTAIGMVFFGLFFYYLVSPILFYLNIKDKE